MQPGKDYIGVIAPFFCHDGEGNLLFYRRSNQAKDGHGVWDCSGGTVKFGEQPLEAVQRKLLSQYGVEPIHFEELPARSVLIELNNVPTHWLAIPFIVQVNRSDVVIGEPTKMDEITWRTLDNLPQPLHPGAYDILMTNKEKFSLSLGSNAAS